MPVQYYYITDFFTLTEYKERVYAPKLNLQPPFLHEHAAWMLIFVIVSTSTDSSAPNAPGADEVSTRTTG